MNLFLTGTDTDVGKTCVAALLVRALRVQGVDADAGLLDARRKAGEDDALALDGGFERVARMQAELAPDGAGENDLAFAGNFGLHGKTVLPCEAYFAKRRNGDGEPITRYTPIVSWITPAILSAWALMRSPSRPSMSKRIFGSVPL